MPATQREPLLFALGASAAYGAAVAQHVGVPLSALEERTFEDGEHKSRPLVSVRGRDAYVIHSLYGDREQSANDKLVRMLFFIGALRDSGAARVTAICPYLAYARKDRRTKPRDPVTTRYVASVFEAVGTDVVVTVDVHNLAAYENAFRCRTEHLDANGIFVRHVVPLLGTDEPVVVAPDAGGIKRAEAFRQRLTRALGHPVGAAFAEKYRSAGVVTGDAFVGDVQGKVAIVIDDLISAGTTVARVAQACRAQGASRIVAAATHGVFAPAANEKLAGAGLDALLVTDTIPAWRIHEPALQAKLVQLSTVPLVAGAITALHEDGSLTALLEG